MFSESITMHVGAACCSRSSPCSVQSFCVHVGLCAHPEHVVGHRVAVAVVASSSLPFQ